ncbi:MAG: hypothetical protein WCD49_02065 [Candidatus Acidiferrales bacterium]
MSGELPTHIFKRGAWLLVPVVLCASFWPQSTESRQKSTADSGIVIPAGTILPVRLNSTISSGKSKPGEPITGRVMQKIPLPHGASIKEGSKVVGHIVAVTRTNFGAPARITFQFDQLLSSHHTIPVTTDLRVIAGFMELDEAQIPTLGAGESDVYRWLTTVQIGGDAVYGDGGPVIAGDDSHQVIGKRIDGGVVGQVRAKPGTNCRGPLDGNNNLQALWLFSSDACGVYGLAHISIEHAGRTDPIGRIVLASDNGKLKIPSGTGMLLRTIAISN